MTGALQRLIFRNGDVFDGLGDRSYRADVVVQGDRIIDVGIGLDGDVEVDVTGLTVCPGFIDVHVHLTLSNIDVMNSLGRPFSYRFYEAARNALLTLQSGITTVRDAAGADLGVKQAQLDGLMAGPRLQIAVNMISQTGGHNDGWLPSGHEHSLFAAHPGVPAGVADGPDEVRRLVRMLLRHGADVIKVATSGGVLSPGDSPAHAHFGNAELRVLVEEATSAGAFVMAHAKATDGIKNAVRAGIRSIEHGIYLDDEAIGLMLERGTWLVPTLGAPLAVITAAEQGARVDRAVLAKAEEVVPRHRASIAMAIDAGVPLAMGTDAGIVPHGENLDELARFVELGLTPSKALAAATSQAARLMGIGDLVGSVERGKVADLVLIEGGIDDVRNIRERVVGVWQGGVRAFARTG
jgi:imidazolonepropionase-like amidohydrolase